MKKKLPTCIFPILIALLLFLVGEYLIYQFILYKDYTSGKTRSCYTEYNEPCRFGEECITDVVSGGSGYMGVIVRVCRPRMYDPMELVLGWGGD